MASVADALKCGDHDKVRELLQRGYDPNIHIESGTFLLEEATRNGNLEIVKLLLEFGSDPNLCGYDNDNMTPLHFASVNGKQKILEELLNAGANTEATDKRGWTSLHRAVERGHVSAVNSLLKHGANPDCRCVDPRVNISPGRENIYLGHCPLMTAIEIGSPEIVELLLKTKKVNVNYVMAGTSNLVMGLVKYKDDIVEKLLRAGADANYCNSTGCTPLYYAYDAKSVELLLDYRAHPDGCQDSSCRNRHKRTPLLWFIGHFSKVKSSSCAQLLIHRGCRIDLREKLTKKTPLDLALECRQLSIAKALVMYGCRVSKDNRQTFQYISSFSKDIDDFYKLWLLNPQPLSHQCCLRIRKSLQRDFLKKLDNITHLEIPKALIRNITMQDIYEEIKGSL